VPDIARAGRAAWLVPGECGVVVQAHRTTTVKPIQHRRIEPVMKTSLVCDSVQRFMRRQLFRAY